MKFHEYSMYISATCVQPETTSTLKNKLINLSSRHKQILLQYIVYKKIFRQAKTLYGVGDPAPDRSKCLDIRMLGVIIN